MGALKESRSQGAPNLYSRQSKPIPHAILAPGVRLCFAAFLTLALIEMNWNRDRVILWAIELLVVLIVILALLIILKRI